MIAVTHVGIDVLKSYKVGHGHAARWSVVDQTLHALVIAWIAAETSSVHVGAWLRDVVSEPRSLALIAASLVVTRPTSTLIRTLTSRWDNELVNPKDNRPGAGNWIGLIERTLIVLFVVTDHFEAVGVRADRDVAELRDRGRTRRPCRARRLERDPAHERGRAGQHGSLKSIESDRGGLVRE